MSDDNPRENPAVLAEDEGSGTETMPEQVLHARNAGERTKRHDEGSDANDTPDGLTEAEEAMRHAAEDIPVGSAPAAPDERIPVFERGSLPPRV